MKRARSLVGTVSHENTAHPLIRILTIQNYSTIRQQLYEALNLTADSATLWSLLHLSPGIRLRKPFYDDLLLMAKDYVISHSAAVSIHLQREILTCYRHEYGAIKHLEESLTMAMMYDAPLHFLQFLWNEHLTAQARNNYIACILTKEKDFTFGQCKDGIDIVAFLWEHVFQPNVNDDRVTTAFLDYFIRVFLRSHFSFAVICWFETKLRPHRNITWSRADIYLYAVQKYNYPAARDCFACMNDEDTFIVQHCTPHVYDLLYDFDAELIRRDKEDEIYEFLEFLFNNHGPCTLQQYWKLAYCFTESLLENNPCYAFLSAYHARHFSALLTDAEATYILECLNCSVDAGLAQFLAGHASDILAQLIVHPLFAEWLHQLRLDFNSTKFWSYDGVAILEELQLPKHIINPFLEADI